ETSCARSNEGNRRARRNGRMAKLNDKQAKLFIDRNWGVIATVREDGSPHATPVWIDYDGKSVLVNSAYGRTKVKNIERDPRQTARIALAAWPSSAARRAGALNALVQSGGTPGCYVLTEPRFTISPRSGQPGERANPPSRAA